MLLWLIFAAITAATLATLLWPLLHARDRTGMGDPGDTAIYRDQLAEIETDVSRGLIGEAEAKAARIEISRRLLASADKKDGAPDPGPNSHGALSVASAVAIAIALPALSLFIYLEYGSPLMRDQPLAARLAKPDASQEIAVLVEKVEARLRSHPEDGRGWDVIAPVYFKMQRYSDAADAYGKALRLQGENTARLSGYGEALVLANSGIVSEKARKAFDKAYARDKSLAKPRFWLGIAEEQDGRFDRASAIWRSMLADAPQNAPWRGMVTERLQFAQAKSGEGGDTSQLAPGPSQEQVAAAQEMSSQDRKAMINEMVKGLAQRLEKDGDDLQGWLKLVRAYSVLGRKDEALAALQSARANFKDDEKALTQLAALADGLGL